MSRLTALETSTAPPFPIGELSLRHYNDHGVTFRTILKLLRQKTLAHVALKRQNHGVFSYKGFDHIALVTRNLTAMKTFYCDGLGLAVEQENKAKAGYNIVTLRAGDAVLDLFEAGPTNPAPSANLSEEHFCLCASGSSIYDVIATLKRKGLEPTQAEVNSGARGKGLSTFVRDPDGNKVEIKVD